MNSLNQYENLLDIPIRNYEGYYWLADSTIPTIVDGNFGFSQINFGSTFVIEAMLYNSIENISVMIKHTGQYQIHEFRLNEFSHLAQIEEALIYLPYRFPENIKEIKFSKIWMEQVDDWCEGWPVKTAKAIIFKGFNSK